MISAWWLLLAFWLGALTGVLLFALVNGNRNDDK